MNLLKNIFLYLQLKAADVLIADLRKMLNETKREKTKEILRERIREEEKARALIRSEMQVLNPAPVFFTRRY